jgi:DNA replication and repair protein RecF
LLEAIWLFSGAKSFRGAKDGDFTSFGESSSAIKLNFCAQGRSQTEEIKFSGEKKTALLNEIKQESVVKLAGEFCCVVFSPDHLSLVKQGAEKRRKFIDTSLCQAYPKYIRVLESYAKILRQRNFVLKDIPRHPGIADTLEAWDENLLICGAYITHMRARYVKKLAGLASGIYDGISSGKEFFSARYLPGTGQDEIESKTREELKESFRRILQDSLEEDIRTGVTNKGPHRDDIEITVGGASARNFGSQGQQRSCILALKLAECGILEERNAEPPVVLLDDVMSELDKSRREYLLNRLEGKQTFITCCDAESFSSLKSSGLILQIKDGAIV